MQRWVQHPSDTQCASIPLATLRTEVINLFFFVVSAAAIAICLIDDIEEHMRAISDVCLLSSCCRRRFSLEKATPIQPAGELSSAASMF